MRWKPSLFDLLERDWQAFASSREADEALRRWTAAEPSLGGFDSLTELLEALRGQSEPEWRDHRMLAVLRLARTDRAARQLAVQVVQPALVGIARLYFARWGRLDASSTVIVAALERVATFPTDRRHTNLAGHIVRDVRHTLHKRLARELGLEKAFGLRRDLADIEDEVIAHPERTAADRVVQLVAEAVRARRITHRHGELVVASRLGGVDINEIALAWDRPPQTVRRMRHRAERALASGAVA
jgi:hypothetical protein